MELKNNTAFRSTETQDLRDLDGATNNIYESLVIMSKRADQINDTVREELHEKLEEFATSTESLEEIFDNKEQIEVSKFYENLPKPHSISTMEWRDGKVYFRYPDAAEGESQDKINA